MKKIIGITVIVVLLMVVFVGYKISKIPIKPVHYHANFAMFVDGTPVDFAKPEFMHISPCTDSDEISTDPKENVHLHDLIGNVVHVHAPGITWKTFFQTVKYWEVLKTATNSAVYLDSKQQSFDILEKPIMDQSRLLVLIGTHSADLKPEYQAVGNTAKEYDAGKVGIERCGSTGSRTLWQRFTLAFRP